MSANSGESKTLDRKLWADYSGVVVSSLCAVHCALTPLVAMAFPHILARYHAPWVHIAFLAVVAPLAIYAFKKCYGEHGRWVPLVLGGSGLVLLTSWELVGVVHSYEPVLTVLGSGLLISGHWLNLKFCKHTRASSVEGKGKKGCC